MVVIAIEPINPTHCHSYLVLSPVTTDYRHYQKQTFYLCLVRLLAVLYLSQALTTLISTPEEQGLALIELILTSMWLAGASMFSRWRGEELGLEIRKAKKD